MSKIFASVNAIRAEFLEANVKKTGYNSYQKFHYFELSDIVPTAIRLCEKHEVATRISFDCIESIWHAVLTATHTEDGTELRFRIPAPFGDNAKPEQAVGSAVTYYRRYLWQLFLELVENDSMDSSNNEGYSYNTPTTHVPSQNPEVSQFKAPIASAAKWQIKTTLKPEDGASFVETVTASFKVFIEMANSTEDLKQIYLNNRDLYHALPNLEPVQHMFNKRKEELASE